MVDLILSYEHYRQLRKDFAEPANLYAPNVQSLASTFMGLHVAPSAHFPSIVTCSLCAGTGEGIDSTYCRKCQGAGRKKAVGLMGNTLIMEPLPKAFSPYFPKGMVPLPPLCRGLP